MAHIEPRVMQVLTVLADAADSVVTREELFRRCWGNPYVGDDSLNRAIAGARRIASGVAADSFAIENIPRTGYRLTQSPSADPLPSADADTGEVRVSRRWVAGGLVAAAAATGGLALWVNRSSPQDPAARLIEDSRVAMRAGTPEGEKEAIALLEQGVANSPASAEAWGLLALTRARVEEHGAPTMKASPAALVDRAAARALQLDPDNADAKAARACAIPYYGDWLAAERRFDAVLAEHPDHLYTKDSRAFLLGAVGRMREGALDRLKFSGESSFDCNLETRRIYALWFLDRIEEADRAASRATQMWPRQAAIWFARLWLLTGTGRLDRALQQVGDATGRPKLPPPMVATLQAALGAAISKRPEDVEAATGRIMTQAAKSVPSVINAMMLLNLMGAVDAAFDLSRAYYLEQGPLLAAMEWRPGQLILFDQRRRKTNMLFTPTAAAMQQDPRFLPLMQAMGLVDYWERRGVRPDFMARTVP
jgi:tetratricopeptide (TPR) repeat protein